MHSPQRHPGDDASPAFWAGRKGAETHQALLWQCRNDDPTCPSRLVRHALADTPGQMSVTLRQLKRWRKAGGRNRGQGRPRRAGAKKNAASQGKLVSVMPRLSCVGVQVCAHGRDQQPAFDPVVAQRTPAVPVYTPTPPGDACALLHPREATLLRRWQALFFAPVLGIDRLSAFETPEPPRRTLRGRGSRRSTLRQLLGHLARVGVPQALRPVLGADKAGQMISVEGHLRASWSRRSMHQGKITRRGRIMAGSHAVSAQAETGQAVCVASSPPAMPLSQVLVAECQPGALATGSARFVLDRAVHAVILAAALDERG